ncbi:MAG: hypothetical protein R6U43_12060 [Candidatus Krumholzibacteriales bacterium]
MLEIKRLVCPHCGRGLKGSEPYITRFCSTCLRHWIITENGLRSLSIRRAVADTEADLMLPFWVTIIDNRKLADDMDEAAGELRKQSGLMAGAGLNGADEDESTDQFIKKSGMEKMEMLSVGRGSRKMAGRRGIDNFISEIRGRSNFRVYVPAFISSNPFAYLKAGRLLTSGQPAFGTEPSASLRNPVLCSVDSAEAVALTDFVFLASLPKSILRCGRMLKDIKVQAAAPPALVNFPFRAGNGSLISIIGGFSISSRLVQRPEPAGRGSL